MNERRVGWISTVSLHLLIFVSVHASASQYSTARALSVSEYIAQLDALISAVDASRGTPSSELRSLVNELPRAWQVETPQRTFDIPTGWLARDQRVWMTKGDAAIRSRLLAQLRTLRSEATFFEHPAADLSRQRVILTGILNQPEFRSVHGPTWIDRMRQRVFEAIGRLLLRLFKSSAISTIGRVLVYALILIAVIVMAMWTSRYLRQAAGVETLVPDRASPPSTEWPQWLTDAQSAAARRDWREAVHCSYWCAVLFLEARGAWRPDHTRTPREYLGLLSSSSEDRSTLAALTRRFERVWYGAEDAGPQSFTEAIAYLKKMGCPAA